MTSSCYLSPALWFPPAPEVALSSGGWLFCASPRGRTMSWGDSLPRSTFNANSTRFNGGGLSSTPGGLRAPLACVFGPVMSLPIPQPSLQAQHLLPSAFSPLTVGVWLPSKPAPQSKPGYPRKMHGDLGPAPHCQQLHQSAHRCSRIGWNVNREACGRPSMAAGAPQLGFRVPVSHGHS